MYDDDIAAYGNLPQAPQMLQEVDAYMKIINKHAGKATPKAPKGKKKSEERPAKKRKADDGDEDEQDEEVLE